MYNYYWDDKDPAKPFKRKVVCNAFTIIPKIATRVAPPKFSKGTIPCWNGTEWKVRADWRQESVYDIKTGEKVQYPTVDVDEAYFKEHYTTLKPTSKYDVWDGSKWVIDTQAETTAKIKALTKEKRTALDKASNEIDMINEAIDYLKEIDEDTTAYDDALRDWKKYRGRLLVLKITTGEEKFPTPPESINV